MLARTAVVVPVVASLVAIGATLVATRSKPAPEPPVIVRVVPPPPPAPLPPPPHPYLEPVGGQYMEFFGKRMVEGGVPMWFLLDAKQLASYRYHWDMERLVRGMGNELASVLDEGCKQPCSDEVDHVRELLRDGFSAGVARPRHWITGEDVHAEHFAIAVSGTTDAARLDVECTCTSYTIGMQLWNDLAGCTATLFEHGKQLAKYTPETLMASGKMELFRPLEAWEQKVELARGAALVIYSGYLYDGDDVNTRRKRAAPRGELTWTTP